MYTLRGEQDAQNKIPYIEWSRDAQDHIKGKGKSGRLLVSVMEFAERLGDTPVIEDVIQKLGLDEDTVKALEHALYMFMKNFTAGHAREVMKSKASGRAACSAVVHTHSDVHPLPPSRDSTPSLLYLLYHYSPSARSRAQPQRCRLVTLRRIAPGSQLGGSSPAVALGKAQFLKGDCLAITVAL